MFWQVTQQLLEGFESTLKLFCITLVAALPLGLIMQRQMFSIQEKTFIGIRDVITYP